MHLNRQQLADIFGDIEVNKAGCWIYRMVYIQGDAVPPGVTRPRWHDDMETYGYIEGLGPAHRVMYAWAVRPLRRGRVIDHLCRCKACCNPAHLEQVTYRTNALRALAKNPRAVAMYLRRRKGGRCVRCGRRFHIRKGKRHPSNCAACRLLLAARQRERAMARRRDNNGPSY